MGAHHMSDWFLFVLVVLAAYRVTRIITSDTITRRARERYVPSRWLEAITCPWCVGFWVSGAAVGIVLLFGVSLPLPVAWWFALSAAVGLIAEVGG